MKRVLIISYYFPPMGAGGVQRTLKFVRYLPVFGWEPIVLTVKDVLYHARDGSLLEEVEERTIIRTESLDPQRLVRRWKRKTGTEPSIERRFPFLEILNRSFLPWVLVPDSKILWVPYAIREARRWIDSQEIDVVFTTSPPQSVHLAGLGLKRRTGLPWIADFRDNWRTKQYERTPTPIHKRINDGMVQRVVRAADRIITVATPITEDLIRRSGRSEAHFSTLPNGYDPADFAGIQPRSQDRFTMTYCGALDLVRNPDVFLRGVEVALRDRPELRKKLRIQLVGSVYGIDLDGMIRHYDLNDIVQVVGYVSHQHCIEIMMDSDLLLLIVSEKTGSDLVTGKIFEYLAAGKPILALVPGGEAEKLILKYARGSVVPPDDAAGVAVQVSRAFTLWERGELKLSIPRWKGIEPYERRVQTETLAGILDAVVSSS
jgi:glycosyltransferase involved in cell wall biosynthesis